MNPHPMAAVFEQERQRFGVPGMSVAIVTDGEIAFQGAFGKRDADAPADERTLFAIASCTKAFTATLIATLVSDGLLDWDTPVRTYLPEFTLHDPIATELVTPRDLLSHRTGLPRHDLVWYADPDLGRREIVEQRLRHLPLSKPIRQAWQYNNLMYLTAGYLAGERLGTTWEEALRDRILDPLQMSSTCFSPETAEATGNWAYAYGAQGGDLKEMPRKNMPACGPAGSIYSCAADLARWLVVNANGGRIDGQELLAAEVLEETRRPAMPMDGSPWPEVLTVGYALGWRVEIYRGHRIIQHSGGIDGFSSRVAVVPGRRTGTAVLTNLANTGLAEVAMYSALDHALGLDPLPWGERIHEREDSFRTGADEAMARRSASAAGKPPAQELPAYSGRYQHSGYGTVAVDMGRAELHLGELTYTLTHRTFETWDASLPGHELARPMTFLTDADGVVTGIQSALEPTVAPILFQRVPAPELFSGDTLAGYVGGYALGTIPAQVQVHRGRLELTVEGMPRMRLAPHAPDLFTVEGDSLVRVRFVRADGIVTEAILEPDQGVLRRT